MKLGYFTMPLHPVERDWRQTLEEDREAVLLADELGFERSSASTLPTSPRPSLRA